MDNNTDNQNVEKVRLKYRVAQAILGALLLLIIVCFVAGMIEAPLQGLILIGVFGGLAAVMWAAITLGEQQ